MASPTSAKEWKKATQGEEIELPSGNVALVRRPGMESLFAAGVLPDELTKLAMEQVRKAERGGAPDDFKKKGQAAQEVAIDNDMLEKFMQGENAIADIFEAFDKITVMCVIKPTCLYHRRRKVDDRGQQVVDENNKAVWEDIPYDERDEDILYSDEVDIEDKTFIFNFVVGGSRDIASFRNEFGNALATIQPREDVEVSSVGTPQPEQ